MMLIIFGTLAASFFLINLAFADESRPFFRKGWFADLCYIPVNFFLRIFVNGTIALAFIPISEKILPETWIALLRNHPVWLQALILLFVLDFVFYGMHRLKHRWGWWWRLHETHHSSADLDWLSTVRFHPLEKILDRSIYLLPLLILGVSEEAVLIWAATDVFFGMFSHSNIDFRLGPVKYLFVGPEMHRWHHVRHPERRECNFGNNFSIFDWLFGTAYVSREKPRDFGISDPDYPQQNVLKQITFAFRKKPAFRPPSEVRPSPDPSVIARMRH